MSSTNRSDSSWRRRLRTLLKNGSRTDLNRAANDSSSRPAPRAVASESTPLLKRFRLSRQDSNWNPTRREKKLHRYRLILTMCLAFSLVLALGNVMLDIASVRLLQMSICRDYYRKHGPKNIGPPPLSYVNDSLCKLKEIETSLLDLRVLKGIIMIIPGT